MVGRHPPFSGAWQDLWPRDQSTHAVRDPNWRAHLPHRHKAMDPTFFPAFGKTCCSHGSEQPCQPTLRSSEVHPALTVPQNQRTALERVVCKVSPAPKHMHAHWHRHPCMHSDAHTFHAPQAHTQVQCNVLTHLSLSSDVPKWRPCIPSPSHAARHCHVSARLPAWQVLLVAMAILCLPGDEVCSPVLQ